MLIRDNQICQFGIRRLPFGAIPRFQLSLLRQQPYRGWPVGRAGLGAIGVGLFPFCLLFCFLDEYKASLIYIRP